MDVEQAMKWASLRTSSQGCDDQDYAAFTTLAAEVRRLSGAVPAGCVRDDKGVDRQVLGTLRVTADGCVVGDKAKLWLVGEPFDDGSVPIGYSWNQLNIMDGPDKGCWGLCDTVESCYSTRASAEAARWDVKP